jgi:hypothetical protein
MLQDTQDGIKGSSGKPAGAAWKSPNGACLTVGRLAEHKRLPVQHLKTVGLYDTPRGVAVPYFDATGDQVAIKMRTALVAKQGSRWPAGTPLESYGRWKLDEAAKAGLLILVEGESDCWALWHHGLPALGLPGANTAGCLTAEQVEAVETVYVHREPDKGGETFVQGVAARLKVLGYRGRVYELRMPSGTKDPADLHVKDPAKFLETIKACILGATPLGPDGDGFARDHVAGDAEPWGAPLPLNVIPAVPPFPACEVFPARLADFAAAAAKSIGCPVDFLGVPMLGVAGGAVGASRALEIKAEWVQRPLTYTAVVGAPGDGKTPALTVVAMPMHESQQKHKATYEDKLSGYERDLEEYKKKKGRDDCPDKPARPVLERVQVENATVESLGPILAKNPRGVCLVRDELSAWVAANGEYKQGRGSDRQFWLSNWAGTPATIDRKQQEVPVIIPHPFVAVVGGIQPDMLVTLTDPQNRSDGFLDRLLFSYPDAGPAPEWTWEDIPDAVVSPWREAVNGLLALNMPSKDGAPHPEFLKLTPDARTRWKCLIDGLTNEMNHEDFPPYLRGAWSKFKVYAARLALIVHLLRDVCGETTEKNVDGESVRRSALLIDYFKCHFRKVMAVIGGNPVVEKATRILCSLVRNPELDDFTRRDLYRLVRGRFKRPEELDGPLGLLVAFNYLRAYTPQRDKAKRGPNPTRYLINPEWDRDPSALATGDSGPEAPEGETRVTRVTRATEEDYREASKGETRVTRVTRA